MGVVAPGVFALEADGQHSDGGRWTPPGGEEKKVEKEAKAVLVHRVRLTNT